MEWMESDEKKVVQVYDGAEHRWEKIGQNLGITNPTSIAGNNTIMVA